jgi:hypothetical protein
MTTAVGVQREITQLAAELAREFRDLPVDAITRAVRSEFGRRASSPVQDFVPIFVQRSIRKQLRAAAGGTRPASAPPPTASAAA